MGNEKGPERVWIWTGEPYQWHDTKTDDSDVEYVRADLVSPPAAPVVDELLKAGLRWRDARTAYMTDNAVTCREYGLAGDALAELITRFAAAATAAPVEQSSEDFERAYFCAVRALRHLKGKNHDFIPLQCAGCQEVALFLTEPGYRGDEQNPVGTDFERPY